MVRRIQHLMAIMLLAIGGMITANAVATAQQSTCIIVNGQKVIVYYSTNTDAGTSGNGSFTALNGPIPPQGPVNAQLRATAINAVVPDPTYGSVTTNLDITRTQPVTTIRSNIPGQRYPASASLHFFGHARLASSPKNYVSRTELVFENNNLQSILPFGGATFTLQNDVEFYDFADPNRATAFTLRAGTTNVSLN